MSSLFVPLRSLTPRETTRCRRKKHGPKPSGGALEAQKRIMLSIVHDRQMRNDAYEARLERPEISRIRYFFRRKDEKRRKKSLVNYYSRLKRRRRSK